MLTCVAIMTSLSQSNFGMVDGKVAEIVWCTNIFHLTWPASPPYLVKFRCYELLHNDVLFATNYLTTELAHSKLKYGLFNRVISCHDRSAQNCQNLCSKCVSPCGILSWLPISFLLHVKYTLSYRIVSCTRTQALRLRRVSMHWGAVLLKHKKNSNWDNGL